MSRIPKTYSKIPGLAHLFKEKRRLAAANGAVAVTTKIDVEEAPAAAPEVMSPVDPSDTTTLQDSQSVAEPTVNPADNQSGPEQEQPAAQETADAPAAAVMPDYSAMEREELLAMLTDDEKAELPNLKKVTLVKHLTLAWDESHA